MAAQHNQALAEQELSTKKALKHMIIVKMEVSLILWQEIILKNHIFSGLNNLI